MTSVTLVCSRKGEFRSCSASGHANFADKGKDIVCAAETVVLRTAMEVLEETEGLTVNADTSSRGNLAFSVENKSCSEFSEKLVYTAEFIRKAFKGLEDEFPECVQLREITED